MGRKVLIASYYFPPDAGVGALRPARFARVLPRFGWQPYVLTVRDEYRTQLDSTRLTGLEAVTIVRTREFVTARQMFLWVRARLGKGFFRRQSVPQPSSADLTTVSRKSNTLGARLRRYLISLIVLLPDDKKGWALYSALRAAVLIRRHRIECLMTSSPPASIHVIGMIARTLTRVKWVADFRDPWIESLEARPSHARSHASDAIERRMERAVVTRADRVLTTTEALRGVLQHRYPDLPNGKVQCIPNGIDRTTLSPVPEDKYSVFTITYAGSLYEGRTPEPVFRAISELIRDRQIDPAAVRIKLVGNCESIDGVDTGALAQNYGLGTVVEVLPFVRQDEAIRIMRKSHLLLVLAPAHHRLIVPAKLYDYLASGSAILALAEAGAAADFVHDTKSGRCFAHGDLDGLRHYLRALIRGESAPQTNRETVWIDRYDSVSLTARLAAELSAVSPAPDGEGCQ